MNICTCEICNIYIYIAYVKYAIYIGIYMYVSVYFITLKAYIESGEHSYCFQTKYLDCGLRKWTQ